MNRIKMWAKQLKQHIFVLYLACKSENVPWYAKFFAGCVVAYAFSPIDLIPDFIPILGYLDDLILIPIGILLALKLIPEHVLVACEAEAQEMMKKEKPKNWFVGTLILLIWAFVCIWVVQSLIRK
ncbi:DUF1232 domain-containing protein [Ectobacillus antri]|uniref:DUF1232 domain-containing protein n=1 Tax=Ectobacillus antri TaxID=2486280 RepID=A0ABT6H7R3_9BACI|nr:DUF1232 domain-containing protein [Ectobacillus antri]MDG4657791.1 DUF1232 domain-containing protein [Ectobacillus antri]MDG5754818.1 DUF1232 domain-containing protein [Ectobacillus antri]